MARKAATKPSDLPIASPQTVVDHSSVQWPAGWLRQSRLTHNQIVIYCRHDFSATKTDVYSAIADSTRRALLLRLARDGEKNVTELLEPFSISQPAVSKHLRILREARLVRSRKVGRIRVYAVEASKLREVHDWVTHFEKYWDEKLDALGHYLDKRKRKKDK